MPANDPEYQKRYGRQHYLANKQRYVAQNRARVHRLREEINDLKRAPCLDCGGTFHPWQMDFDHRPGESKLGDVAQLVAGYRRMATFAEIAKCDLVCANCHRHRTYLRQQAEVT